EMIFGSPPMHPSPLASPTSPSDYTVSGLGRRASTASMRSEGTVVDDNDVYAFVKPYAKKFCTLMVQALVQSRTNERYDTVGDMSTNSRAWFNLEQDEIGEISVHIKKSVNTYPPMISSFSVDFILYTADGETLPLETWCFSYEPSPNPFHSSSSGRVSPSTVADTKSKFYKDLGILLRSIIVSARMTPMHRYYVKKQGADSFVITYRVLEGKSTIDLGADCKKKDLGTVPAPYGNFFLQLAYRTKMEIDRAATPASNDSFQGVHISPGTSPHLVGGTTPSSFCDVLSQFSASPGSQMATSPPSRSRAVSEATSEPGYPTLREKKVSGSSAKSVEEEMNRSKEDKPKADVDHDADSDDEEMNQSKLESPEMKKIPFANLLISSYTGILMTNGLSPTERERIEAATSFRVERPSDSVYRSRVDSAVIPEEDGSRSGSSSEESGGEGGTGSGEEEVSTHFKEGPNYPSTSSPAYSGLSDELSNSLLETSTRTVREASMTATLTVAGGRKSREKEGEEEEEEGDMTATLRDDNTILRGSLLSSPVSALPLEGGEKRRISSSESERSGEGSDDEEDSFVRITPLFSTGSTSQPGADLSELITQLKGTPDIEGNAGYGYDHLSKISLNELPLFSSLQGDFDRLVSQVKEAVEEDERKEREGIYTASKM
ncbi:hypothetical protein PFISCL1PPCAC_2857, partial [Pristionchus fissidentatus]